jgi:hypothetical protein
VRCPHCYWFFITYDQARIVRCRGCDAVFQVHVSPRAKKFRPPRDRSIMAFDNFRQAQRALTILMKAVMEGVVLTNEQAAMMIRRELQGRPAI